MRGTHNKMQRLFVRTFLNTVFILYFLLRCGGAHQIVSQRNDTLSSPSISIIKQLAAGNSSLEEASNSSKSHRENISSLGLSLIEQMNKIIEETNVNSDQNDKVEWSSNMASDAILNITKNPTSEKLSESLPHLVGYVNTLNKYMSKISSLQKHSNKRNISATATDWDSANNDSAAALLNLNDEQSLPELKIDIDGKLKYIRQANAGDSINVTSTKERPSSFLGRSKVDPPLRDSVPDPDTRSYRKHALFCLVIMSILSLGVFAWLKIGIEGKKEKKSSLFKRDGPRRRNKQPLNFGKAE